MRPDNYGYVWPRCWPCNNSYRGTARAIVPISYSISDGLTSLVAQAKDDLDRYWVRLGLASVLYNFVHDHARCLEVFARGTFDLATVVPSHPSKRGGRDHMKELLGSVAGAWGVAAQWDLDLLTKLKPSIAHERRNVIDNDLFVASVHRNLSGRRVLLLDDLYTSGSTTASAAAALIRAGADPPVIVTIGRQISNDATSVQFVADNGLGQRSLEPGSCVLHGLTPGQSPI